MLQEELQYAQQLASGIITDLRSLLVDMKQGEDAKDKDSIVRFITKPSLLLIREPKKLRVSSPKSKDQQRM